FAVVLPGLASVGEALEASIALDAAAGYFIALSSSSRKIGGRRTGRGGRRMKWLLRLRARVTHRLAVALGVALAATAGLTAWQLQGDAAATIAGPFATATRGALVVSVGGVGRIVSANAVAQMPAPPATATGSGSTAGGAGATSVVGGVFPRATGRLDRFLVAEGQRVRAGQALAVLDDGGAAAAAVRQAETELATALLELQQKRTSDPLRGVPATRQELAAAALAVDAAKARLARLLAPPRRADVES